MKWPPLLIVGLAVGLPVVATVLAFVIRMFLTSGGVSEQAARTSYEKSVKAIEKGEVKLISFHKTNGRRSEQSGRKYYEVEYEVECEVLEDLWHTPWLVPVPGGDLGGWWPFDENKNVSNLAVGKKIGAAGPIRVQRPPKHKKGEILKRRGWLPFEETDKGWQGLDGNVY
jgi:hypothetical protein